MAGKSEDLEDRPTKKDHLSLALCKWYNPKIQTLVLSGLLKSYKISIKILTAERKKKHFQPFILPWIMFLKDIIQRA